MHLINARKMEHKTNQSRFERPAAAVRNLLSHCFKPIHTMGLITALHLKSPVRDGTGHFTWSLLWNIPIQRGKKNI